MVISPLNDLSNRWPLLRMKSVANKQIEANSPKIEAIIKQRLKQKSRHERSFFLFQNYLKNFKREAIAY